MQACWWTLLYWAISWVRIHRPFFRFLALLDSFGVAYQVNPRLVRGLDYYSHTVFEWITDDLGAQGTVCAGGRYDGLVEIQGGRPWPGVGFAMGQERLVELMRKQGRAGPETPHVYLVMAGEGAIKGGLGLAEPLRDKFPVCESSQISAAAVSKRSSSVPTEAARRWHWSWAKTNSRRDRSLSST